MTYWEWGYAIQSALEILTALDVTLGATFLASVLALVLGLFLAIFQRAHVPIIGPIIYWFVELIRRTPLLVQLYFIFFVLPEFGLLISPLTAGVIGLGLHNSAYMSEVYRAGISAVPNGQWEAARALDIQGMKVWQHVILPQAIPIMIPALGNYIIIIFKETAILSIISVVEVMGMARIIGNEHYRYFEPITVVGLIYLSVCLPGAYLIRRLRSRTLKMGV